MLSQRLAAIAKLVNKNSIVADIGSDHGLLPCFLLINKISKKAYAIDNKQGPLNAAIENIDKYSLNKSVFPVLADGLNNLKADVDSIVLAGMGFLTIKIILETNLEKLKQVNQIIIQSNTDVNLLRKWIMDKQYLINDETIVYDNNKYYFIFNINPQLSKEYGLDEWLFSDLLIQKNDEIYYEYLNYKYDKLKKISKFRKKQLQAEIEIIESIIKRK